MKKRIILISSSAILLAAAIITFTLLTGGDAPSEVIPEPLTQEQIALLREDYPAHFGTPFTGSIRFPSVEEQVYRADTMLHVKVIEQIKDFDVHIEEEDYSGTHTFFGYIFEVIDDGEGLYKPGTEVSVRANVITKPTFPKLEKGMEIITPVALDPEIDALFFSPFSMYYVTPDGYTLAVYDLKSPKAKDGMHIKALMEDFRRIKRSPENAERWKTE